MHFLPRTRRNFRLSLFLGFTVKSTAYLHCHILKTQNILRTAGVVVHFLFVTIKCHVKIKGNSLSCILYIFKNQYMKTCYSNRCKKGYLFRCIMKKYKIYIVNLKVLDDIKCTKMSYICFIWYR